jgi:MFS family permease
VGASLTSFTLVGIRRRRRREQPRGEKNVGEAAKRVIDIVRGDRTLQAFLVANALWELALAALKTFVVLWATKTLGFSLAGSSGAIAAGAAIVLVGALVSGPLGDRHGRVRVMRLSLGLYGAGLLVPFLTTATLPLLLCVPFVAFGGGVTMSLPYALLMPMMPHGQHGSVTGLYSLSRGLGTSLGPLLGGIAVHFAGEDYRWVWLVCAVAILLSIPAMRPLRDD